MIFSNLASKYRQDFFCVVIAMFGFFPLLSEKTKGLPVFLLLAFSIIFFITVKDKRIDFKFFIENASLFLINIFSIFYSLSFVIPKNRIETSLSLIVIPLIFSTFASKPLKLDNLKKELFFNVFILSSTVLAIIMLINYYNSGFFFEEHLKVNSFRESTTSLYFFGDHPIYISIFYGLSIFFILHFLFLKKNSLKEKGIYLLSLLFLMVNLILLSSKGVLIAILISVIFYLLYTIKGKIKFLVILTTILFFIGMILFSPTVARRFKEFKIKTTYTEFHPTNSSSIRIAIYNCAIKKIKERPILGFGWGESKKNLKLCYKQTHEYLYNKNYNSHNQYFGYILNGGVFGLIVILFFLVKNFTNALRHKDYIFASIIIFFSIVMLFENILERQSGIIIFIFTICFLNFINKKNK